MSERKPHPIQPVVVVDGVTRFQSNPLIKYLLSNGGIHQDDLCILYQTEDGYTKDDYQQLMQLIGYSVCGYRDLHEADLLVYDTAQKMADGEDEKNARIAILQEEIDYLKSSLKEPIARLYNKHPDDLFEK